MSTLVFVFLTMLLLTAAMAIGVMMGRKPIAGSCGGMKALNMGVACEVCGGNPAKCDRAGLPGADLGLDATVTPPDRKEF
jgi:hypothetical protein